MQTFNTPCKNIFFDEPWRVAMLQGLNHQDSAQFMRALDWVAPYFNSAQTIHGEPLASHAAGVAYILAGLQTDVSTRIAALVTALFTDASQTITLQAESLEAELGPDITPLVQGAYTLQRLETVTRAPSGAIAQNSPSQKETLRRMLLAMAADLRIVLMRLAACLCTLRWYAKNKIDCPGHFANDALDLYAPLANRLGIWQIKWEMEDLAFRFLYPKPYKHIASLLEERRVEREEFITATINHIQADLTKAGIQGEVTGRPKHIYSIWNKMKLKALDFDQLFDLRALRVIVADVRACYTVLGLLHEQWEPITNEFDDYISRPKQNGYRSLHTVLDAGQGRFFEVQIRTHEMHQFAEYGIAAHWLYKENHSKGKQSNTFSDYDRQLGWMRQLLAWNQSLKLEKPLQSDLDKAQQTEIAQPQNPAMSNLVYSNSGPYLALASAVNDEPIYVLTPQAQVIELPAGATPLDFAYHLHTDLGHRCRGAKVNGHMVPLHTRLVTGQTVEIVTTRSGGPSRDWINPQLGFLASTRARTKVRSWFNAIELQQRMTQGQALVEKELQRLGKTAVNLEQLAQQLGFTHAEDLYVAASKEEFSLRQINAFFKGELEKHSPNHDHLIAYPSRAERVQPSSKGGVLVGGVGSLLTQFARCCHPAPPDAIVGFVTRGRGVSVHRANCHSYRVLSLREPQRLIEVAWGVTGATLYPISLSVQANNRPGLLKDISEVFAKLRLNVIRINMLSRQSLSHIVFTLEVNGVEQITRVMAAIQEVAGVEAVWRD